MRYIAGGLLAALLLSACSEQPPSTASSSPAAATPAPPAPGPRASAPVLRPEVLATLPDTLRGCGEYFSADTSALARRRYLFASDLTRFAVVQVRGQLVYLTRDSAASPTGFGSRHRAVYRNARYRAVLDVRRQRTEEEVGYYRGTLQLTADSVTVSLPVHGEVGC